MGFVLPVSLLHDRNPDLGHLLDDERVALDLRLRVHNRELLETSEHQTQIRDLIEENLVHVLAQLRLGKGSVLAQE